MQRQWPKIQRKRVMTVLKLEGLTLVKELEEPIMKRSGYIGHHDGIFQNNHNMFYKIYKVNSFNNYETIKPKELEKELTKIANILDVPKSLIKIYINTANRYALTHFYSLNKNNILKKRLEKKPADYKEHALEVFDKLEEYCIENLYEEDTIALKRMVYICVPYVAYHNTPESNLTRILRKLGTKMVEKNIFRNVGINIMTNHYTQYRMKKRELRNIDIFFSTVANMFKNLSFECKELTDEETLMLINSTYYPTIYLEEKNKDYYLTIKDLIRIASRDNKEFAELTPYFQFYEKKGFTINEMNGMHYLNLGVFNITDITEKNLAFDFYLQEGDLIYNNYYPLIKKDKYAHKYLKEYSAWLDLIEKRRSDLKEIPENLIEKERRAYQKSVNLTAEGESLVRMSNYVTIRSTNEEELSLLSRQFITNCENAGIKVKTLSSDYIATSANLTNNPDMQPGNFDNKRILNTLSPIGFNPNYSYRLITMSALANTFNPLSLDFNDLVIQNHITDMTNLQESYKLRKKEIKMREYIKKRGVSK